MTPPRILIPALSLTLIVSWGSLYYAFAVLARPIQAELHWSAGLTIGAYSLALLACGLCAYPIGKTIDRKGGRLVMTLGSVLAGLLFAALGQVTSIQAFYAVWIGLGAAMAATLYEPAFAVIVATYPHAYRKRIGLLTLAGGLASTVFWPLTHALVSNLGWRGAALALGATNLLLCAPLHWFAVPTNVPTEHRAHDPIAARPIHVSAGSHNPLHDRSFWLLGLCFMAFGIVTASMAVHVIPLLESRGMTSVAAVALAALIGPMQVSGRCIEVLGGTRLPALLLGTITVLLIPIALTTLLWASAAPTLAYLFVVLYGAGVGLTTIVKATTPAEIFGRGKYASMSGAFAAASTMARAIGPSAATAVLSAFHHYNAVLVLLSAVTAVGAASYWLATWGRR